MEQKKSNDSPIIADDKPDCPICVKGDPNPAHRAAYVGHVECLKYVFRTLKDTRILLDSENNSPLHAAVAGGQVDIVKYLLQFTRIPVQYQNNQGETCVHIAALRHKLECMKILLSGSFKKSQSYTIVKDRLGCTVLHYAVLVNDNDVALWLLQRFGKNLANISNDDGVLPLHVASAQGNIEFIQIATKYDVQMVNKRDRNGATAAFYAVQSGYLQCLKYLVEKSKADVNTLTSRGQSLLHAACLNGHASIIQWLFTKMEKSAVFGQTNDAATTFHCASYGGHGPIIKMLHKVAGNRRFAVNSTDRRGNTALHLASLNGHLDCVQFLLYLGAEPRLKNFNGQTTIDVAEKRGHQNVVTCLTASINGSKESIKKKFLRHKSHSDVSTTPAEEVRPNSLSTSGYSSGAAASDGYGHTALPLNSLHYNEPSSGYASSSDKGAKEIPGMTWKSKSMDVIQTTDTAHQSLFCASNKTNWLLRRKDNETKEIEDKSAQTNNYGVLQHLPIELMSPHQTSTAYGGPILVTREIQTDFDPLDNNVVIVNEHEQIIFSSVPSIPTIFTKSQQKVVINQMSETTTTTNDDSESSKKLKKRRRKPSPRERKKLPNKNASDSDFWSNNEMHERKRSTDSISSTSSSENSFKVVVHLEKPTGQNAVNANDSYNYQNKANIYAGIAAAERIDEYLKGELEAISDSDSNHSSDKAKKKNSNVTTAVAIVHKSSDQMQQSPLTLDHRTLLVKSDKMATDKVDRRPSDLGPPLSLPIMHDPTVRRRSVGDIEFLQKDNTLDIKSVRSEQKQTTTLGSNLVFRSDRSLSAKSYSLGDLNSPDNTLLSKKDFKQNSSTRSMMDLNQENINRSNIQLKSAFGTEEYDTLRGHDPSKFAPNGGLLWQSCNHQNAPPPPPPPLPPPSITTAQNNRLFYKKSAATTFKARDKLLNDHLKTNQTKDQEEQTLNGKTVTEIRRRLEDKLITHVNNSSTNAGDIKNESFEMQPVCNQKAVAPKPLISNSYLQTRLDEDYSNLISNNNQIQNFRYFGTSNASDYALRGRINEIIRLGSVSTYKQTDNKIYEIDEESEDNLDNQSATGGTKLLQIEKRFDTILDSAKVDDKEQKIEIV